MIELAVPDITRGEPREIVVDPVGMTSGYASRNYRLAVATTPAATPLASVDVGAAEYRSSSDDWLVSLTGSQTLLFPVGEVYVGVWELGRPEPALFYKANVGNVPGRVAS